MTVTRDDLVQRITESREAATRALAEMAAVATRIFTEKGYGYRGDEFVRQYLAPSANGVSDLDEYSDLGLERVLSREASAFSTKIAPAIEQARSYRRQGTITEAELAEFLAPAGTAIGTVTRTVTVTGTVSWQTTDDGVTPESVRSAVTGEFTRMAGGQLGSDSHVTVTVE